jgi:phage tail sheath protein FI
MPEYLAPGVYVEEVSFRSKSIEGVSTTTTGFIGPCSYGPVDLDGEPEIITSVEEFERMYGAGDQLEFNNAAGNDPQVMDNYLWHAVRAFYAEGGRRLYIARVFLPRVADDDGHANAVFPATPGGDGNQVTLRARFPGEAGNMVVRFTLRLGGNLLSTQRDEDGVLHNTVGALSDGDVVWVDNVSSPPNSPAEGGDFYLARLASDGTWSFVGDTTLNLTGLDPAFDEIHEVSVSVTTIPVNPEMLSQTWEVALDPNHKNNGVEDGLTKLFADQPPNRAQALSLPIVVTTTDGVDGLELLRLILAEAPTLSQNLVATILRGEFHKDTSDLQRSWDVVLEDGNDGMRPGATEYEGRVNPVNDHITGLEIFKTVEDVSIVAAPGSSYGYENGYRDHAQTIMNLLIIHASQMRYRIAVLDAANAQSISQVRDLRAKLNSKYAALYYPWVRVLDPITRRQISLPPSGFVAGIYARNDTLRAVYKAPANEVVNLALGFEKAINKAQQEVLNPEGINCFRFFEGRGYLLWGARMATDDPEWKYVNLRRYFAYLERSIDIGTQWAVFEPNGPDLWANIKRTIESFLLNEWTNGALLGEKPDKAYFVRCDRSTMTQNDLDNGRLVCLIGVAPLRPAEFVIFRIGQWTGDARR